MRVVLAEKPSVGKELAKVMGANNSKDGYIEGNGYAFTWAFGHLLQLASPEAYGFNSWKAENLPMLPEQFKLTVRETSIKGKKVVDKGVLKQLNIIKKLFQDASEIIVATDAGREGELIFRYIYYYLNCKKPFKRLWISSQTDEAIKKGFNQLKPGSDYDSLFYSAQCRSEADWLIGLNATQALSIAAGNNSLYSLGRVQTPTLSMICARYLENKNFIPQKYYQIKVTFTKDGIDFYGLMQENFKNREDAINLFNTITQSGRVHEIDKRIVKENPPLLHDLSSLQQEANKKFCFSADETLNIAQSLYEAKFISYPRTGSRFIGNDVFAEIPGLINILKNHPTLGSGANSLSNLPLNKKSVNPDKVTDHHALLITHIYPQNIEQKSKNIYDLIASRLLEAFHQECIKERTKITILAGPIFIASGTVIIKPGWRNILNEQPEEDNTDQEDNIQPLPLMVVGDNLPIKSKDLLDKLTKPKLLFTEATLLQSMETAGKDLTNQEEREAMKETGLGTPATRAATIETLLSRQYIIRQKKHLVPTDKGLAVYQIVKDKLISQADLTGQWENKLEEIRKGGNKEIFKSKIKDYTTLITKELLVSGKALVNITPANLSPQSVIICPLCKKAALKFNDKAVNCSDYKNGCRFTIWRKIAEKELTDNQLTQLIKEGRTGLIKGFMSKQKKHFDAILINNNGVITFDFPKK